MSTEAGQQGQNAQPEDQAWYHGIDLFSRLTGSIAELTRLQQSLLFAELSQIAYMPPAPALKCVQQIGFSDSHYFDRDGAQAYQFRTEHDCVIVCRGTEPNEWNDVKADANAVAALAETVGRVHSGFKKEVDDLWPNIEQVLSSNRLPLWFAGHSLGGAMATICAGRCKISKISSNPEGLFTYGSPRVGDRLYVSYYRLVHVRWVNNNDIVTRVPPAWMGYRHAGREMYIDYKGRVRDVEGWRRVLDRLRGFGRSLRRLKIDHFSDHSIEDYIAHIHAAVQKQQQAMTQRATSRPRGRNAEV
ncbi:MAG: lipase family protein [Thermoguttaceae bacterium]|jgi:triacylglycerol lipase|nr:lipase family protein [Thermoguttaceae bacterium]